MYSIAKQRKGSEVDWSAVTAHTACACLSCRRPLKVSQQPNEKIEKVLYDTPRVRLKKQNKKTTEQLMMNA